MTAPASQAHRVDVPEHWYNVLAGQHIELPPPRASTARTPGGTVRVNVPKSLVRQSLPLTASVPIPQPVLSAYREYRPTPLRRLERLERALDSRARIYVKDETGNVAGSHKYLTALAQAYYYAESGVRTLVTSTAAGQWGTAVAAAAARFGLDCVVHMVPGSYDRKPGRRTLMQLLGARVVRAGERADGRPAALRDAMTEAVLGAGGDAGSRWILGGSEPFAILHSTVIGQEARDQLAAAGETRPPVLIGYLGGGKNVGGLGLPFLADEQPATIRLVESAAYPVLTRGAYGYVDSDDSGRSPRALTYALSSDWPGAPIQAEGMRYHAAPPLMSELYRRSMVQAVAYPEEPVFASASLLLRTEGLLPSVEAAHAVHDACRQAVAPGNADRAVVFCLSDHGHHDLDAYRSWLAGDLAGGVA